MRSICVALLIFSSGLVFSQTANDEKARAYFQESVNAYNRGNYSSALNYIDKTEDVLGSSNARILNMRVKISYSMGEYDQSMAYIDQFSSRYSNSSRVSEGLKSDTRSYIVKIETKLEQIEQNRIRIEKARLAREEEERKREEQKLNELAERSQNLRLWKQYRGSLSIDSVKLFIDNNPNNAYINEANSFYQFLLKINNCKTNQCIHKLKRKDINNSSFLTREYLETTFAFYLEYEIEQFAIGDYVVTIPYKTISYDQVEKFCNSLRPDNAFKALDEDVFNKLMKLSYGFHWVDYKTPTDYSPKKLTEIGSSFTEFLYPSQYTRFWIQTSIYKKHRYAYLEKKSNGVKIFVFPTKDSSESYVKGVCYTVINQ